MISPARARHALLVVSALFALECSSSAENTGTGGAGAAAGATGTGGGAGAPSAVIHCDTETCNAVTEKCCFANNDVSVVGAHCAALSTKCDASSPSVNTCDDASDCVAQGAPKSFCCANLKQVCADGNIESCILGAQCALPGSCDGANSVILCDPTAENACPVGSSCQSQLGSIQSGTCVP